MSCKKILAIIPARAGSKRLPNKNMMEFNGLPLIEWTIQAALACEEITEVMVTTDCPEIAFFSNSVGAEVPFLRPSNLSSDESLGVDVVLHTIDFYAKKSKNFDFILLLQPTSPLRTSEHISNAISEQRTKKSDSIISVCECEHPPQWSNTLNKSYSMDNFLNDNLKANTRSQNLLQYYRLNGAIFLVNTERFLEEKTFYLSNNSHAFVMPTTSSIDIDSLLDFKFAEFIMKDSFEN